VRPEGAHLVETLPFKAWQRAIRDQASAQYASHEIRAGKMCGDAGQLPGPFAPCLVSVLWNAERAGVGWLMQGLVAMAGKL
jgi:hypothetical protein